MALTVARRLFRRSLKVNGANDGTILGIDHRGIGLTVAENINPFRHGLEEDAVRSSLHVDGFDRLQGLGVPHHDRAAAAKTAVGPKAPHGFCSSSPVVMWDTQTLKPIKTSAVQGRPDGALFEPMTERA